MTNENTAEKINAETYLDVTSFLFHEAELIDNRRFREWLSLMTDDFIYRVPVRVTRDEENGAEFLETMSHVDDDRTTIEMRIHRLETEYAWAENPPSRTRHYLSNIRAVPTENHNEFNVKSNLLLYRSRGDSPHFDILSCERHDVVRFINGKWYLAKRVVLLDQSTLPTHNLSFFF